MGLIKEDLSKKKLRGGYYTPIELSDFITNWAINSETNSVLEPSCGDGNFLISSVNTFLKKGTSKAQIQERLKGVELIPEEAETARERLKEKGLTKNLIVSSDFFHFLDTHRKKKYDAVVGNPPFIRYQSIPKDHRDLAMKLMKDCGFNPNRLTNIWVPFLSLSAQLLTKKGKLGMVIPAELFQVKYAGETRIFLSNYFERITIVTFKKLIFKGIQQEVVLLLCEKSAERNKGIRTIECESLDDLESINFEKLNGQSLKAIDHSNEKWTKYFLKQNEIDLLRSLKIDRRVTSAQHIMEVNVGIVTGRNKFFMMKKSAVLEWGLEKYTIPVVSKSNQLSGINFTKKDFNLKSNIDQSIHLFLPPDKDFNELPKACQEYIRYGESLDFHKGYKCRIRDRWYIVPSLWVPDGFSLRQVSDHPKIVINNTGASATDTIHRVKFKKSINSKDAVLSFTNSLTFAFSEITGRSYGGGVLTFEPSEMKELSMPKLVDLDLDFNKIDELVREKRIDKVLDIVDNEVLVKSHGFDKKTVILLRDIWYKLSDRRRNRN